MSDGMHRESVREIGKAIKGQAPSTMGVVSEQTGLLPCPFCGGKAIQGMANVWCANCGSETKADHSLSNEDVKRFWNRRAASQSTPSQAPTDTSKEKENASCLAAPSRKQEGRHKEQKI